MTASHANAPALLQNWVELAGFPTGDRLFRSRRLNVDGVLGLHLALRSPDGAPCLLAIPSFASPDMVQTFETGGLRLSKAPGTTGVMLVLSLEASDRRDLFALVCADVVASASDALDEQAALVMLAGRLAAWRAFLRDQSGPLSRAEIVGLIGELLILGELLDHGRPALAAWRAPDDGLHDFLLGGWALEVKTSLGAASRVHVSSLDQLDDTGLSALFLGHVRLVGDQAGTDLGSLVETIEAKLPDEPARREFRNALLRRGLAPGDTVRSPHVRMISIAYFRVVEGFPRLRRVDAALGIAEASYEIEVRALAAFAAGLDEMLAAMPREIDV